MTVSRVIAMIAAAIALIAAVGSIYFAIQTRKILRKMERRRYDDAVTKITEIIDQSVTGIDKPSYGRINPPGRGLIEINDHTPLVPLPPLEYLTDADASQLTRAVRCPFCHEPAKVDTVTSQIICENEENLASEFRRRMNEVYRRLSD